MTKKNQLIEVSQALLAWKLKKLCRFAVGVKGVKDVTFAP